MNFYNDNDPFCCDWLRMLMNTKASSARGWPRGFRRTQYRGLIAPGVVDERSICDIDPEELKQYTQCHFFAGIGGWSLALRLAGWPDDEPVWTGSCPCQPLSCAGQRKGHADERHLWPAFHALIAECRPATVFGEQVAGADGREWLAGVRADLEGMGYAVGAADLCAAGVGAPHARQRIYWVADAEGAGQRRGRPSQAGNGGQARPGFAGLRSTGGVADAGRERRQQIGRSAFSDEGANGRRSQSGNELASGGATGGLGNAGGPGSQGGECKEQDGAARETGRPTGEPGGPCDFWADYGIVVCLDKWPDGTQKARRIEPGTFPLAHGVSARVGRLRGYGNAIVPQVAAEFVSAFLETRRGGDTAPYHDLTL